MFADVENHIKIARRAAPPAGITFTGHPKLGTVVDARGNLELKCFFTNHATFTVAGLAFVPDDLSSAVTLAARPRNGEESLLETDLAVYVAGGAGRPSRAFFSAAAVALGAGLVPRHLDLRRRSERGIFETEIEIVSKVSA